MTRLKVTLFGAREIVLDNQPVHIARRKAFAMFIYLVVTGKPHERDRLGSIFWPESSDSRNQVRVALSALRSVLGSEWFSEYSEVVQISNTEHIWVDVLAFKALSASNDNASANRIHQLEQAMTLVHGDFLAGFTLRDCPDFDLWMQVEEVQIERKIHQMVAQIVDYHIEQKSHDRAIPYLEGIIARDPLDENSYYRLMELHLKSHRIHEALRVYDLCRERLENQLGIPPSQKIQALREQTLLQRGDTSTHTALSKTVTSQIPLTNGIIPYAHQAFFGRDKEMALILKLLSDEACRVVSLVGIGGIGKTHLAAQISTILPERLGISCYFIPLEDIETPEQALLIISNRLNLHPGITADVLEEIIIFLKQKQVVLILDNLEQLVPDILPVLLRILQEAHGVKLLVTSRVMLQIHAENVIRLHGLSYPQRVEDAPLIPAHPVEQSTAYKVTQIQTYESVRFFIYWAQKRNPMFQLIPENTHAIAELCRIFEGVPLAIRLAAVWCDLLSADEVLFEVQRNIGILQSSLSDIPEKHQSMQALFDSIWIQLTADEQQAFANLAIFRGGFTRHAAEQVAGVTPQLLKSLLDKSLLIIDQEYDRRYHIHEILRRSVVEKEQPTSTFSPLAARYIAYFTRFINVREQDLYGKQQHNALREIDSELTNIQYVWTLAAEQCDSQSIDLMIDGISLYMRYRGYWPEGRDSFAYARRHLLSCSDAHAAYVHGRLSARFYNSDGSYVPELLNLLLDALVHHDAKESAYLTAEMGWQSQFVGSNRLAIRYFEHALQQYQAIDDDFYTAEILRGIAFSETLIGDFQRAVNHNQTSINIRRRIGDGVGLSMSQILQGEIHLFLGDFVAAKNDLQEASTYVSSHINEFLAVKQAKFLPLCLLFCGDIEASAHLANRLVKLTETPSSHGENLLGRLTLALVAALKHDIDQGKTLIAQSAEILSLPTLNMGQGAFTDNLRLVAEGITALVYALIGQIEETTRLNTRLKAQSTSVTYPVMTYVLFTAEVIQLFHSRGDALYGELRSWLEAQVWLKGYLQNYPRRNP